MTIDESDVDKLNEHGQILDDASKLDEAALCSAEISGECEDGQVALAALNADNVLNKPMRIYDDGEPKLPSVDRVVETGEAVLKTGRDFLGRSHPVVRDATEALSQFGAEGNDFHGPTLSAVERDFFKLSQEFRDRADKLRNYVKQDSGPLKRLSDEIKRLKEATSAPQDRP